MSKPTENKVFWMYIFDMSMTKTININKNNEIETNDNTSKNISNKKITYEDVWQPPWRAPHRCDRREKELKPILVDLKMRILPHCVLVHNLGSSG